MITRMPPALVQVGGDVAAAGLQVREQRRRARDPVEVVDRRAATPASRASASRCSTALVEPPEAATTAIAFSNASRVMMSLRPQSSLSSVHRPARRHRRPTSALRGVHGGDHAAAHRRDAERLEGGRHRVRGELAAAGAGAGQAAPSISCSSSSRHLAGGVRADGLEDVLDRHVLALEFAGRDRAAVEHHAGHVEPGHRHHRAGDGLVAAGERDERRRTCGRGRRARSSRRSPRG